MGFLKKFGQIALKVTQIAIGTAPLAEAAFPGAATSIRTVSQDLAQVASIIQQVEIFGQALSLPGASKLTAATPAVAQIILQSSILSGHKINDPALFRSGCMKIADGMADVLNSLDGAESVDRA